MPPSIPLTTQVMRDDQAYLLDNGRSLCLWIGRSIRPDFIQQVSKAPGTWFHVLCCEEHFARMSL